MGLIDRAITVEEVLPDGLKKSKSRGATTGREFDVDMKALHEGGFFVPGHAHGNQPFELRSIKRRLLRRLGMLQRSGGNQRALRRSGRARNLVLMTSTRPGEGKTFSAVNLALSFAFENNQSVLLIDGDAPRPKVRGIFGLPDGPGLSDKLLDPSIKFSACAHTVRQAPLTIMTQGSQVSDATELFSSTRAQAFFADLSAQNPDRLIIVDAPPLLAATETIALARHVDEVIFVVEADKTPEPSAAAALDELLELNPNVSLILNRCLITAGGSHYEAYEHYDRTVEVPAGMPREPNGRVRG